MYGKLSGFDASIVFLISKYFFKAVLYIHTCKAGYEIFFNISAPRDKWWLFKITSWEQETRSLGCEEKPETKERFKIQKAFRHKSRNNNLVWM